MEGGAIPPIMEQKEFHVQQFHPSRTMIPSGGEYSFSVRGDLHGGRGRVPSANSSSTGSSTEMELGSVVGESEAIQVLVRCR